MSARRLLEQFGKAALQPRFVNGQWRKAAIPPRVAADLRRVELLAGRDWPYDDDKPARAWGFGLKARQPKGHKWEKEKADRLVSIEKNMDDMPNKVAAYREGRKLKEVSWLEMLTTTAKERRLKQYRAAR